MPVVLLLSSSPLVASSTARRLAEGSESHPNPPQLTSPVLISGPLPPAADATIPPAFTAAVPAAPAFPVIDCSATGEWLLISSPRALNDISGQLYSSPLLHLRNAAITNLPILRFPNERDAVAAPVALPMWSFRQLSWWPFDSNDVFGAQGPAVPPSPGSLLVSVAALAAPPSIVLQRVVVQLPVLEVAGLLALAKLPGGTLRLTSARAAALEAAATADNAAGTPNAVSELAMAIMNPSLDGVSHVEADVSELPACFPGASIPATARSPGGAVPGGFALLAGAYQGWGTIGSEVCFVPRITSNADSAMLGRVLALLRELEEEGESSWWASYIIHPIQDPSFDLPSIFEPIQDATPLPSSGTACAAAVGVGVGAGGGGALIIALALFVWLRKKR